MPTSAFHAPTAAETAKRLADELAWHQASLAGAYDRVGRHDARWDADVRKAFDLIARVDAKDPARPGDANDQAWYLLKRAVSAGCNDPLAVYELASLSRADRTRGVSAAAMRSAALALEHTTYPPYRRGIALMRAAHSIANSGSGYTKADFEPILLQTTALLEHAQADFAEVAKDRTVPDAVLLSYVVELGETFVFATHGDRKAAFDPAFAAVKASRGADDALLPVMTAAFFNKYAWDARGTEMAHEVADSAWPSFAKRLDEAEKSIRVALAHGTGNGAVPQLMMTIEGGTDGDLDEIIAWFKLGVVANPGDRGLYEGMLNWALPKWHGSVEDTLALVRDSVATGNWNARIPLMAVDAHDGLSVLTSDWKYYFKIPAVCDQLASVYDEFLKRYPNAGYDRGEYAKRLTYCGRWADAKRQVDLIAPDRLRVSAFGGQAAYEKTVDAIASHLKAPDSQ